MQSDINSLENFKIKLANLNSVNACLKEFDEVSNSENGEIFKLKEYIKSASIEEKKQLGPTLQVLRNSYKSILDYRINQIQKIQEMDDFSTFDPSIELADFRQSNHGHLHPITIIEKEVLEIFTNLGFDIFDGKQMQTQNENFTQVGTPDFHPARGMQDTFFIDKYSKQEDEQLVMRTQVTANLTDYVFNHAKDKTNFKVAFPGLAFRAENMDSTHDINFHQLDFWMVGENLTNANLFDIMKYILQTFFNDDTIKIRFRPSYFPFTQPSYEVDFFASWFKGGKWIEIAGCGPIHSNVIKNIGLDPEKHSGLAAGFGLTRLAQLKLGISNIPQFYNGNLNFLRGK